MSVMIGIAKAALWPEANLAEMLIKDEKDQPTPPVCTPIPSLTEHLAYQARTISLSLALSWDNRAIWCTNIDES